ncbi:MAG: hypothetical protein BMS9Abin23_0403 [Thermodesulfobacteriota bacterium]|nr:MAG: hypothetical protein BMS9Abin23_0403 [Thermodesulfobacteriota bacterium]
MKVLRILLLILAVTMLVIPAETADAGVSVHDASVLKERGDYKGAERAFREILSAEPENMEALKGLASLLKSRGRYGQAKEALESGGGRGPSLE